MGASLVFLLIWLPGALIGDRSVITDPMVYMGLPLMVISIAVGALVGVPASVPRDGHEGHGPGPTRKSRAVVALVAGSTVLLATWFFLMATGAVDSWL